MPEGKGCPECGAFLNSQGVCPRCARRGRGPANELPRPVRFAASLLSVGILAMLALFAVALAVWLVPALNQAVRQTFLDWFGR